MSYPNTKEWRVVYRIGKARKVTPVAFDDGCPDMFTWDEARDRADAMVNAWYQLWSNTKLEAWYVHETCTEVLPINADGRYGKPLPVDGILEERVWLAARMARELEGVTK